MTKYKDVYWTLPHQKRYFGSTTIGSDNLIRELSEDNKTVMDIYNLITSDPDAKKILKKFIDTGYENFIMKDFVTDNEKGLYRMKSNDKIIFVPRYDLKRIISKELKNKASKDLEREQEEFEK